MLDLNDLRIFCRVAEHGGFTAAARALNMPKSTVSKRVAELERRLGVRLIQRSSRSFAVTETGRDMLGHAIAMTIEAEAAEEAALRRLAEPSGAVRITASLPTTQLRLAPVLPALAQAYPRIRIILHATDRFVDLVQENFDLALRSHYAPLPDSGLVARRLGVDPVWLVAAPAYLLVRGRPGRPEDLATHDGLLADPAQPQWRLERPDASEVEAAPSPRLFADEATALLEAARAGLGIASLPAGLCRAAVAQGALERVLPGWTAGAITTSLLTPHRRGRLPSVRAVADFLIAHGGA